MKYAAAVLVLILAAVASAYLIVRTRPIQTAAAATRTHHPAANPGVLPALSPAELGNFDFDEHNPVIPADVQALNGSTIRLHGRMIPLDATDKIHRFALIPLTGEPLFACCGTPPPPLQQTVIVNSPQNAVSYCDEVVVEGKLTIGLIKDDDFVTGIFALDPTSVKPVPQ